MLQFIDSHAHVASDDVFGDVELVLKRAQADGVAKIINIGTDPKTLERGLALSKKYPWLYNAAATHPHDVEKDGEADFPLMSHHAKAGHLVAIGEIGLDYHYTHSSKESQHHFLRQYLKLALETKLPVIIHCREAFADFFRILDEEYVVNGKHGPGVLHCFTGTLSEAHKALARGWYISFSGVITFKKSEELRQTAKQIPLDRIIIETDTPYLAPQSHRGKRNEPSYLPETARCVAQVKDVTIEEFAEATVRNTLQLFPALKQ